MLRILFLCMPRLASAFGGSRKENSIRTFRRSFASLQSKLYWRASPAELFVAQPTALLPWCPLPQELIEAMVKKVKSAPSGSNASASSKATKKSAKSCKRGSREDLGLDKWGRTIKRCKLCRSLSSEESPLITKSPLDKWKGCRPWRACKDKHICCRLKGMIEIAEAVGNICSICYNVYRITGCSYDS